ncbi:hypothetical protein METBISCDRAFT_25811 [Metschnikowia bicuspidata]|uniref:Uncharacterized protein n=1 Tax=Metschnikowia bicuspidata TaxID=27322 RepID=A0A4P9ZH25_9ASCO|nr:hypothetical protein METBISCDRAFT_25811 [Metschnikowia bicuspidata]
MDNRRVMKAYRNWSGRSQPSGGLVSYFKRIFSGPARDTTGSSSPSDKPKQRSTTVSTASPQCASTFLADLTRSAHRTGPPASDVEDPNCILSAFFQEKAGQPLSEVEYEGVMSLLERSKASITLPFEDLTDPKTDAGAEKKARETVSDPRAQQNSTFAPYSQTKLRNVSACLNNSSFAGSEYRPVYHTFNGNTSRANTSLKRVYEFSGIPSPYQTRIQAPNFATRKLRRVAPLGESSQTASVTMAERTDTAAAEQSSAFRPKSKTANALLSILGGDAGATEELLQAVSGGSAPKHIHNPYLRPRRRVVSRHVTSGVSGDMDSLKARTSGKPGEQKLESSEKPQKREFMFGLSNRESTENSEKEKTKKTDAETDADACAEKTDAEKTSVFAFGSRNTESAQPEKTTFMFGSTAVAQPQFVFGGKGSTATGENKPKFTFSAPASNAPRNTVKDTDSTKSAKPTLASNSQGSKGFGFFFSSDSSVKPASLFGPDASNTEAPADSVPNGTLSAKKSRFGATSGDTASVFEDTRGAAVKPSLFGSSEKTSHFGSREKPLSLFVSSEKPTLLPAEAPKSKPFSFGQPAPKTDDPALGDSVKAALPNGKTSASLASEFTFPDSATSGVSVRADKVKMYESLFEF